MKEINYLSDYIKNFDQLTYPTQLYQDLVVNGQESRDKLSLMGAWKTGSIRLLDKRHASDTPVIHTDTIGNSYIFTRRWKEDAPVGYITWKYINERQELYRQRIPVNFSKAQPDIVTELVAEPGFGFIWALFVLHCFYPEVYPLYDQHVYRAYKYYDSEGQLISGYAPKTWEEYTKYRSFFLDTVAKLNYRFWEVDRGLWALGKEIKRKRLAKPDTDENSKEQILTAKPVDLEREEESWLHSLTLGGKAKLFHWKLDEASNLHLLRQFKSTTAHYGPFSKLEKEHITQLSHYVAKNNEVSLSNNVEKLYKKTEKEGLGHFMYECLKMNVADAQLSSQIAALFVEAGIWQWNGQQRNMKFKASSTEWVSRLRAYYNRQLNIVEE